MGWSPDESEAPTPRAFPELDAPPPGVRAPIVREGTSASFRFKVPGAPSRWAPGMPVPSRGRRPRITPEGLRAVRAQYPAEAAR